MTDEYKLHYDEAEELLAKAEGDVDNEDRYLKHAQVEATLAVAAAVESVRGCMEFIHHVDSGGLL
jgi:hypothetical protein